jgi:hypothetical protein
MSNLPENGRNSDVKDMQEKSLPSSISTIKIGGEKTEDGRLMVREADVNVVQDGFEMERERERESGRG